MISIEFENYGESLDSTPDFLFMKKHYEESFLLSEINDSYFLEENINSFIFVDPNKITENNLNQTKKLNNESKN
jgi:hypothetical protein